MWTAVFSIALMVLEWFLTRAKNKAEMQKKFFEFIDKMNEQNRAVEISDESQRQLDELRKRLDGRSTN